MGKFIFLNLFSIIFTLAARAECQFDENVSGIYKIDIKGAQLEDPNTAPILCNSGGNFGGTLTVNISKEKLRLSGLCYFGNQVTDWHFPEISFVTKKDGSATDLMIDGSKIGETFGNKMHLAISQNGNANLAQLNLQCGEYPYPTRIGFYFISSSANGISRFLGEGHK